MVSRPVSRTIACLLLASAAIPLAGAAVAQSGPAAGTLPTQQQPPAAGGLVLPGQVQTSPGGSTAAGTINPQQRPQAAPPAAGPAPHQAAPQQQAAPRPAPAQGGGQPATPAAASRAPGKPAAPKGAWEIVPQVFSDGSFKLCAAAAQFDNNLHLLFLQNPEKKTNLILGVPGAQMPAGQQVMVKVSVDGKVTKEKGAVISQPEAIAIPLADDPDLVRAITAGNVLSIEVPGDTATFQMKGATKALKDLGACIDQAKAGTLKLPAPAQPPIPPALAKMLVEAGLKDARAIPIDKIPPQQRPGDFAWQLGERVLGSVRSFPLSEEAGDFGAISQKYLDQLKQSCEGNFTPNFGNVENLTAYGLRTGTAGCDSKEGKIHVAMTMQLIPVPKQQGQEKQVRVLNVYTHETVEAEKARADSANQGIYKVLQERGKQPLPTAQAPQGQAPQQGQAKPAATAPKPAGQ